MTIDTSKRTPITKARLKKMGFVVSYESVDGIVWYEPRDGTTLAYRKKYRWCIIDEDKRICVDTIERLQTLWFALTEKELTC